MTRILVADDDRDIRELVTFKLSRAGYDVVNAADGEEALAAAYADPLPDLVILDLSMPKLTGLEVCTAMRADDRTRSIPVIMLTARAQPSDIDRGTGAGADAYVIKPFSLRDLIERVAAVLDAGEDIPLASGQ